jgi:antitoxin FitA
MATLTIRNVEPSIKERLRVRAAQNGRSMEAGHRVIVTDAVETPAAPQLNLADAIQWRLALEIPPGTPKCEPPTFE